MNNYIYEWGIKYIVNIICYVLDSLRADHISCYGYGRETSPTIDALADQGVRFDHCVSPSTWTRPVAASILSGLYPAVHRTRTTEDLFSPPVPTLPEALSELGYTTVGFESMPNINSEFGYGRGFDDYHDLFEWDEIVEKRPNAPQFDDGTPLTRAEDLNKGFRHWYGERGDDNPFFALLWSNEPHIPFSPPEGFREYLDLEYDGPVNTEPQHFSQNEFVESDADRQHLINLYDCEIRYNDHCLRNLFDFLRSEGLYEETMIVVVGDHGEAFWEHDVFGHGTNVPPYSEVVQVPGVVRLPDGVAGQTVKEPVSLIDLYPTIVECARESAPVDADHEPVPDVQGQSLATALHGDSLELDRSVFAESYHEQEYGSVDEWYAVIDDTWKYLTFEPGRRETENFFGMLKPLFSPGTLKRVLRNPLTYLGRHVDPDDSALLFDLETDPSEHDSVANKHPERTAQMHNLIDSWKEECTELRMTIGTDIKSVELDDEMRDQLEQLGYLT